jgi:TldD protein
MSHSTRREFIATSSLAMAGTVMRTHGLSAQPLPSSIGRSRRSAHELLPEAVGPADLRTLATRAIEAASRAGAAYADIRVGLRQTLYVEKFGPDPAVSLRSRMTYGVRVLVDGAWAFGYGSVPTVDRVVATARNAVTTARGYAPLLVRRVELAPAPVATGEWATPIKEDPFTVPLEDHTAVLYGYEAAIGRQPKVGSYNTNFQWVKETRVFASSEGSLTTQSLHTLNPSLGGMGKFVDPWGRDGALMRYPGAVARSGGFELVTGAAIQDDLKRWSEDVARITALPRTTLDVGRYPVVFDGRALGTALGLTLGRALELDRALGEEAAASGTSYLSPPLDLLGSMIASPHLTVTATRAMPAPSAVKWDDEGVEPNDYTLITNGRLVDYHTSRQSAVALKGWYERQNQPVRSHGCAMVPDAESPVMVRAPHVAITPSHAPASVETLCKDITHGVLVLNMRDCATDHALASILYTIPPYSGDYAVLEIVRGQPVRRLRSNALDISVKRFWKEQLVTLGDASTVQHNEVWVYKGIPWDTSLQSTSAPAALFKDVNVTAALRRRP